MNETSQESHFTTFKKNVHCYESVVRFKICSNKLEVKKNQPLGEGNFYDDDEEEDLEWS